ncbi:hypothetical protein C0Q70_19665 [Pomacea canaliculata]|uniref:Thioredoxin domain-containing protein n=1 Tax=Pomacea canaliculata TaxID=400727 RepID=A0A2T7NK08_POMCA|nr:hypothetical protein C0Q70_19665 [Pomacea canaliculata]
MVYFAMKPVHALFVLSACTRCRILFPFFVAASQAFPRDPEIFFARVHDKRLVQEWGIAELPALIFYRDGIEDHDFFLVDVTVDEILDEIARRLHGNYRAVERKYAVEVTAHNFQEIVKTPRQSVLLLTYNKDTQEAVSIMENVAKVFRNDDAILICKLNVDKEAALRDSQYKSRDVPAVFWYHASDKSVAKRFGGNISIYMQTNFINQQTGLDRNIDGSMKDTSGRIRQFDVALAEHADHVLQADPEVLGRLIKQFASEKSQLERQHKEFADYYIYLLQKTRASGKLDKMMSLIMDLNKKLDESEDLLPKQEDSLRRKRNILIYFGNLQDEAEKLKREKEAEEKKQKDKEKAEEEKQKRVKEEEERKKKEDDSKKTKAIPSLKKMGQPPQYTAQATIHKRSIEEL